MEKKDIVVKDATIGGTRFVNPISADTVKATVTAPKMEIDFHGAIVEGRLDDDGRPYLTIQNKDGLGTIAHIKL